MNHPRWKIFLLVAVTVALVAGLTLPARPAEALDTQEMGQVAAGLIIWSNVGMDIFNRIEQVKSDQESRDSFVDGVKNMAMQMWQQTVMQMVASQGGSVWNYGEYIYGAGDSAAAKYWRAFLQNCTNIDPTVSLSVQASAVEQTSGGNSAGYGYDWCPVRVNVRGVNLQETINLSGDFGWEDFADAMDNSRAKQYLNASANVEEARQQAEATKAVEAMSSGNIPKTSEATMNSSTGTVRPADASKEQVQIPVQSFISLINAATGGVVQASANQRSEMQSVTTTMLLTAASQLLLSGNYGQ